MSDTPTKTGPTLWVPPEMYDDMVERARQWADHSGRLQRAIAASLKNGRTTLKVLR